MFDLKKDQYKIQGHTLCTGYHWLYRLLYTGTNQVEKCIGASVKDLHTTSVLQYLDFFYVCGRGGRVAGD